MIAEGLGKVWFLWSGKPWIQCSSGHDRAYCLVANWCLCSTQACGFQCISAEKCWQDPRVLVACPGNFFFFNSHKDHILFIMFKYASHLNHLKTCEEESVVFKQCLSIKKWGSLANKRYLQTVFSVARETWFYTRQFNWRSYERRSGSC